MDFKAMAKECLADFLKKYYHNGVFEKADFWDWAEIFEMLDDALENIGDPAYAALIEETYTAFLSANGETWEKNPFNDDIMWAVIAMTRAYRLTGVKKYLDTALKNFDLTWARAYSDDLGGGLFWRVENQSKNACVNGPGAIAACLLAEALGDESYFEKARILVDWMAAELYEENGKVYDCYGMDGRKNHWSSTYNQGTYLGANWLLYRRGRRPLHHGRYVCRRRHEQRGQRRRLNRIQGYFVPLALPLRQRRKAPGIHGVAKEKRRGRLCQPKQRGACLDDLCQ